MPQLTTELTDTLGLDVPIIQAPIGSAIYPALAATVADAGALGMVRDYTLIFNSIEQ